MSPQSAPAARGAPAGLRHLRGCGGITPRKFWKSKCNFVHSELFWPPSEWFSWGGKNSFHQQHVQLTGRSAIWNRIFIFILEIIVIFFILNTWKIFLKTTKRSISGTLVWENLLWHPLDDSSSLYDPEATESGPADTLRSPHSVLWSKNHTSYPFHCYEIVL